MKFRISFDDPSEQGWDHITKTWAGATTSANQFTFPAHDLSTAVQRVLDLGVTDAAKLGLLHSLVIVRERDYAEFVGTRLLTLMCRAWGPLLPDKAGFVYFDEHGGGRYAVVMNGSCFDTSHHTEDRTDATWTSLDAAERALYERLPPI